MTKTPPHSRDSLRSNADEVINPYAASRASRLDSGPTTFLLSGRFERPDYVRAYWLDADFPNTLVRHFGVSLLLLAAFLVSHREHWLFAAGAYLFIMGVFKASQLNTVYNKADKAFEFARRTRWVDGIELDDTGIRFLSAGASFHSPWKCIRRWKGSGEMLLLYFSAKNFTMVPRRLTSHDEDWQSLRAFVSRKVGWDRRIGWFNRYLESPTQSLCEERVQQALMEYRRHNYREAIENLNPILDGIEGRKEATAFLIQAGALIKLEQLEEALAALASALAVLPTIEAYLLRVQVYEQLGNDHRVREALNAALNLHATEQAFGSEFGASWGEGRMDRVIAAGKDGYEERALAEAYLLRGRDRMAAHRWHEALSDVERAGQAVPADFRPLLEQARCLHQLDQDSRAVEILEKGVARFPRSDRLHNLLAWIYATSQDASIRNGLKGLKHARLAHELLGMDNSSVLDTRAAAHAACGEFEEAVRYANLALADIQFPEHEREHAERRLAGYERREVIIA